MRDLLIGVCPCKGCNERSPKCHGECEEYLEWNKKNIVAREEETKSRLRIFMPHKIGPILKNARKRFNQFDKE